MISNQILLDLELREWVLYPIFVAVFLYIILCNNIAIYMLPKRTPSVKVMQQNQILLRSRRLRLAGKYISYKGFQMRKVFLSHPEKGQLVLPVPEADPNGVPTPPAMNPTAMMDQMKTSMTSLIPYVLFAGWIESFFAGFVIVQLPIPLSAPFKGMLQSGINIPALHANYVSSLSWYLLCLFGLRSFSQIFMIEKHPAFDETKILEQQLAMVSMQQQDYKVSFKEELEFLKLSHY